MWQYKLTFHKHDLAKKDKIGKKGFHFSLIVQIINQDQILLLHQTHVLSE